MLGDVEHLLDETGSIMLTAYANLLTAVLALTGVLRTFAQGEGSGFYRELLSGLQDVASARPGFVLRQIARTAREEPEVAEQLRVAELSELTVAGLPAGRTREALRRFLEDYGYRGIREAEIAAPRWSEDPTLMFAALRSHLGSRTDVDDRDRDLRRARQEAEDKLRKSVPFPLRPSVTKLLEVVQRFTRMREHLRGHVVEVLGMFRRVALEASRRIEAREPEAGPDAAFFLTLTEVRRVLYDENERVAIRVQRRRLEYERNQALPEPPTTFVGFPARRCWRRVHRETPAGSGRESRGSGGQGAHPSRFRLRPRTSSRARCSWSRPRTPAGLRCSWRRRAS